MYCCCLQQGRLTHWQSLPRVAKECRSASLEHGEASEVCRHQAARLDSVKERASRGRTGAVVHPGRLGRQGWGQTLGRQTLSWLCIGREEAGGVRCHCRCHFPLWLYSDYRACFPVSILPTHPPLPHSTRHVHPSASPGIVLTRLHSSGYAINFLVLLSPSYRGCPHRFFFLTYAWPQCLCLPLLTVFCHCMVRLPS